MNALTKEVWIVEDTPVFHEKERCIEDIIAISLCGYYLRDSFKIRRYDIYSRMK